MTTTSKGRATKQACLDAFKRIQNALPAGKTVTRDKYRKESGIAEADWEYHFGTFAALKFAAGAAPTPTEKKVKSAIAKAVTTAVRGDFEKERAEYGEAYVRSDNGRFKTMLVATDLHDKEIDPFWLRVFLDTAKRVQPDNVVLGGDVFDLPEFGKYTVDPREWDASGRIKFAHDNIFAPLREAAPDAQIDLIEGNHECVTPTTEVLTNLGWMRAQQVYRQVRNGQDIKIASFNPDTHEMSYDYPLAIAEQDNREVYEIETTYKRERVTGNHRIFYNGELDSLDNIRQREGRLDGRKFLNSLSRPNQPDDIRLDPNIVRFGVWLMTDGYINHAGGDMRYWVSFNKIKGRRRRRIMGVVQKIPGINWIKTDDGLEVEGPALAGLLEVITGHDQNYVPAGRWHGTPDWLEKLPAEYGPIVGEELTWSSTHGFRSKTSVFTGWGKETGQALQWFLIQRGVPCAYKAFDRDEYALVFNETGTVEYSRGGKVNIKWYSKCPVVSIQTKHGTLVTRIEGKINFTGNCRLLKQLADDSPGLRSVLGDLHGWTLADIFGLRKFEINYVAKADLKAYSAREHEKELENNYRVYHDNVLVHHFPHARNMGLPGINGHHHKHVVWPMFNVHQGAYEWHQLGAGHRRSASYCEGERWHTGFALVHIDTLTKSVNIEYVPITNIAVVGGKFYVREPSEVIT